MDKYIVLVHYNEPSHNTFYEYYRKMSALTKYKELRAIALSSRKKQYDYPKVLITKIKLITYSELLKVDEFGNKYEKDNNSN